MKFIKIGIFSIIIGICSGSIIALFGHGLAIIQQIFQPSFLCLLCITGCFITWVFQKFPDCTNGMKKIFLNGQGIPTSLPKKMLPITILTTWLTHLFGGSAGREGVAVQLGAITAYHTTKKQNVLPLSDWIPIGMAAGFSALFQTPLAATLFALEVLQKGKFNIRLFLPTLLASYTAYYISNLLHLSHTTFEISSQIPQVSIFSVLLLSIIFGFVGMLFAWGLHTTKQAYTSWKLTIYKKVILSSCILAILLYIFQGRYSGLGTNLIQFTFENEPIYAYDWFLKLFFTIFTLSIGFQGGEVTPLFSIGTCLGVWIAPFLGLPNTFCAILGYCAVFSAATKTILTPICIGLELFHPTYFPYLFLVCTIAYTISRHSIYPQKSTKKDGIENAVR